MAVNTCTIKGKDCLWLRTIKCMNEWKIVCCCEYMYEWVKNNLWMYNIRLNENNSSLWLRTYISMVKSSLWLQIWMMKSNIWLQLWQWRVVYSCKYDRFSVIFLVNGILNSNIYLCFYSPIKHWNKFKRSINYCGTRNIW